MSNQPDPSPSSLPSPGWKDVRTHTIMGGVAGGVWLFAADVNAVRAAESRQQDRSADLLEALSYAWERGDALKAVWLDEKKEMFRHCLRADSAEQQVTALSTQIDVLHAQHADEIARMREAANTPRPMSIRPERDHWLFVDALGDEWSLTPTHDPSMPLVIMCEKRDSLKGSD